MRNIQQGKQIWLWSGLCESVDTSHINSKYQLVLHQHLRLTALNLFEYVGSATAGIADLMKNADTLKAGLWGCDFHSF